MRKAILRHYVNFVNVTAVPAVLNTSVPEPLGYSIIPISGHQTQDNEVNK